MADFDYATWAQYQFQEIKADLNPCNENGDIDPHKLNQILGRFPGHMAWLIVMAETEASNMAKYEMEYDKWYKESYIKAHRQLMQESGGTDKATVKSIDARVTINEGLTDLKYKTRIADSKSKVDLLRGFVKVLDRQATTLQALSANLRSDVYFAGGFSIEKKATEESVEKHKIRLTRHFNSNKAFEDRQAEQQPIEDIE